MAVIDDTAAVVEWRVEQGDGWSKSFTFTSSAVAVDLSSYTWLCQFRDTRAGTVIATTADATVTVGTGSAASGIITVTVADAVTATITGGRHWWRLKGTTGGVGKTYIKGPVVVVDEDG